MAQYIFSHQGTHYTPNGIVQGVADVTEHNAQLTRAELAAWATQPARHGGYVTFARHGQPFTGQRVTVATWTGEPLGAGCVTGVFRNNLTGSRTVSLRIRGTNGATYTGRFGDEWSEFCRLRKTND